MKRRVQQGAHPTVRKSSQGKGTHRRTSSQLEKVVRERVHTHRHSSSQLLKATKSRTHIGAHPASFKKQPGESTYIERRSFSKLEIAAR